MSILDHMEIWNNNSRISTGAPLFSSHRHAKESLAMDSSVNLSTSKSYLRKT